MPLAFVFFDSSQLIYSIHFHIPKYFPFTLFQHISFTVELNFNFHTKTTHFIFPIFRLSSESFSSYELRYSNVKLNCDIHVKIIV